jgi:hypothetical protein
LAVGFRFLYLHDVISRLSVLKEDGTFGLLPTGQLHVVDPGQDIFEVFLQGTFIIIIDAHPGPFQQSIQDLIRLKCGTPGLPPAL